MKEFFIQTKKTINLLDFRPIKKRKRGPNKQNKTTEFDILPLFSIFFFKWEKVNFLIISACRMDRARNPILCRHT